MTALGSGAQYIIHQIITCVNGNRIGGPTNASWSESANMALGIQTLMTSTMIQYMDATVVADRTKWGNK